MSKRKTIAYIDSANLHNAIVNSLAWHLDYKRFRIWLKEKFGVVDAYIFIGYIPKYQSLYHMLRKAGFMLVFKTVTYDLIGKPKGNCDTDLVVQMLTDLYERRLGHAILVSSDGDFAPLIKQVRVKSQAVTIISPNPPPQCSFLLKQQNVPITYITDQKNILEYKKAPDEDETSQGSLL